MLRLNQVQFNQWSIPEQNINSKLTGLQLDSVGGQIYNITHLVPEKKRLLLKKQVSVHD